MRTDVTHINCLTDEEQVLFTLMLLYRLRPDGAGARKVDKHTLLANTPDMTEPEGIPSLIAESRLDEIIGELVQKNYVEMEVRDGKSCYEVTHTGEQVLKENQLHIPSDNESTLLRLLPEEEHRDLLSILTEVLDTRISIMDENGISRIRSEILRGPCPKSLGKVVPPACICCDLMGARRSRKIGVHSYRCHMGLIECIAPFPLAGASGRQGYVFLGRIASRNLDVDSFIESWRIRDIPLPSSHKLMSIVENEGKSEDEIAMIRRIAVVIAALLGALLKDLDEYSTKINTLSEVIEAGSDLLGQDETLGRIMDAAEAVFHYDGATIWRTQDDGRLTPIAWKNGVPDSISGAEFDIDGDGFISWIARERQPLLISDVSSHIEQGRVPKAKYRNYITGQSLGSFVGVPLIVENILIGVFEIEAHRCGQFTKFDQELLMTIARMAGVVIRNFSLLEVLTDISKKDDIPGLLKTAVVEFPRFLGAEYCSIFLFDHEKKRLVLRATNSSRLEGEIDRAYYDAEKGGLTWHVASSGKTVVMKNAQHSPYYKGHYMEDDHSSGSENYGFMASLLGVRENESRGVIRFVKRQGMVFGERDQRLAEILGTWLSLAIDRMQLAIAREHSELLLRIAEIQNRSSTVEELLTSVASEMTQTFACRECEIWLAEKEGYEFQLKGQYIRPETKEARCRLGDGTFVAKIAEKRQIIRRSEMDNLCAEDPVQGRSSRAENQLGIPLIYGEGLIGVLTLANKLYHFDEPEGQFSENDETTGRIIATQLASTIYLYRRREKLSELLRVVDDLYVRNRDTQAALTHMIESVGVAIPDTWGALYRYDVSNDVFGRIAYSAKAGAAPQITNVGHVKTATDSGEPLYVAHARNCKEHRDIINSDRSPEVKAYIESIGSEYVVPLMVVDRLYGVLYVNKTEEDAFTIADMQATDDLARRASLLLESDTLLKARTSLYDAAFHLQGAVHLDEVLQELVKCISALGYDRVRLYLVTLNKQVLRSEKQVGLKNENNIRAFEEGKITFNMTEDLLGPSVLALEAGEPVIFIKEGTEAHDMVKSRNIEDVRVLCMKETPYEKQLEREDVQEWLDFPLIAAGRKVGKITVDNKSSKRPFSDIDCEMLGLFGQYAAQAIQNANLTKERDEIFNDIAHSLALPLTILKGFTGMLVDRAVTDPETVSDYHEIIARAMEHFDILAKQVLNLSRIELGAFALCLEETSVVEIVDGVVALNRFVLEEKDIDIDVKQSIKSSIDCLLLDKTAMRDALEGIVDNAIKFSKHGSQIEIVIDSDDNYVYISVKDYGVGMSREDMDRIWQKHYRGEVAKQQKIRGTGIGLTVTKSIVENHGGKVYVESTLGEGSTFIIALPRSRE